MLWIDVMLLVLRVKAVKHYYSSLNQNVKISVLSVVSRTYMVKLLCLWCVCCIYCVMWRCHFSPPLDVVVVLFYGFVLVWGHHIAFSGICIWIMWTKIKFILFSFNLDSQCNISLSFWIFRVEMYRETNGKIPHPCETFVHSLYMT
jgi:hypothetical protein